MVNLCSTAIRNSQRLENVSQRGCGEERRKKRNSRKLDYFPFDSFSLSFVCLLRDFILLVFARERVSERACVLATQLGTEQITRTPRTTSFLVRITRAARRVTRGTAGWVFYGVALHRSSRSQIRLSLLPLLPVGCNASHLHMQHLQTDFVHTQADIALVGAVWPIFARKPERKLRINSFSCEDFAN